MSDTIAINITGRRFEVGRDVLAKFPDSTLGRVAASDEKEVCYQRPTSVFKCVLTYYQTGHLHIPLTVCPGLVQTELEFWGFTIDDLDPCCRRLLKKFQGDQKDFFQFEKSLSENGPKDGRGCIPPESRVGRVKQCLWLILDEPMSSLLAKIYFFFASLIIVLSILIVFLGSMAEFKQKLTKENWEEFLGDEYNVYRDEIEALIGDPEDLPDNQTLEEIVGNYTLPSHVFVENKIFDGIQLFCTAFFVLELLLKLLCCPSLIHFLKSFLNIVDILAVVVSLSEIITEYVLPAQRYTETFVDAIGALQVLRVLRLLRFTKNITGARVLAFALSNSYKEVFFMALLIAINTILFGTLAHSVNKDTMKDLPLASWWALITMTTVGYGDVAPSNNAGKFIGVLCACMGIMILALTMPLFVDNFLTFYSYGQEICLKKPPAQSRVKLKVTPEQMAEQLAK